MSVQSDQIDETTVNVARQIQLLRRKRHLSQRALARASGLSRNTLSLLERGQTSPTVSTLKRLAIALGVDINAFFESLDQTRIVHVKAEERPALQIAGGSLADLGLGLMNPLITPLTLHIEPGTRSGPAISHDGQDFIFMVRGQVTFVVDEHSFILQQGDSLLFDSHLPHRFHNTGTALAEFILVLSHPQDGTHYINQHLNNHHEV